MTSFNAHKFSDLAKPLIANTVDKHQMFDLAKRAMRVPMGNDPLSDLFSDIGNFFKLLNRGSVDIYGVCRGNSFCRGRICIPSLGSLTADTAATRSKNKQHPANAVITRVIGFHLYRANCVCKMLKVSVLQTFEQINTVEIGRFSTENVEIPENYVSLIRELQLRIFDVIFAASTPNRHLRPCDYMSLFEEEENSIDFSEEDKIRLFETQKRSERSIRDYAKFFLPIALVVIVGIAAVMYFTLPGIGDRVKAPLELEYAVYDYMLTREKRSVSEIAFYNCDGYYWVKVLAEPRSYPQSNLLDAVNQYRLTARQTEGAPWQITTLPLPATENDVPCSP